MRRTKSFRYFLTCIVLAFLYSSSFARTENGVDANRQAPAALVVNAEISTQDCTTGIATVCYTVSGGVAPYIATCTDQNSTVFPVSGMCFENLPPGNYTIAVADSGTESGTTTIEVTQPLTILVNTTTSTSCYGSCDGTVEISQSGGVGAITYLIDGVIFDYPDDFNAMCAGVYTANALDENGCTYEFSFVIPEPQEIVASIATSNVTCTGMNDGVAIVATSGGIPPLVVEYADNNLDFQHMEVGDYAFTITDSEGCVVNDTIHMVADVESDLNITISTTPVSCWNEKDGTATALVVGGQEPISIQWNDEMNQTSEIAVGLTNKQYEVVVTDAAGCNFTKKAVVELTVGCLFIADALTPNGDGYNDVWNIGGLEFFPQARVEVFNRWGQLVFESTGYNLPWNGSYLGDKLPTAVYYYVISNGGTENAIHGTVTIKY